MALQISELVFSYLIECVIVKGLVSCFGIIIMRSIRIDCALLVVFAFYFSNLAKGLRGLNFFIQKRCKRFLATRIPMLILRYFFSTIIAATAAIMLYKAGRYAYYRYNNDANAAELEKQSVLSFLHSVCKNTAIKFYKLVSFGVLNAKQVIHALVIDIIIKQVVGYNPIIDSDTNASFEDTVFYAPIVEELVYRGIFLNLANMFYDWINPDLHENQANQPANLIDYKNTAPNIATALLFTAGHDYTDRIRAFSIFTRGLNLGALTNKNNGNITPSISDNMQRNLQAWCIKRFGGLAV